jgi:hypothetical protein
MSSFPRWSGVRLGARIQLGLPRHDYAQLGMSLDYRVAAEVSSVARTLTLLGGLVIAKGLFLRFAYTFARRAGTGHPRTAAAGAQSGLNKVLDARLFATPAGQTFLRRLVKQ